MNWFYLLAGYNPETDARIPPKRKSGTTTSKGLPENVKVNVANKLERKTETESEGVEQVNWNVVEQKTDYGSKEEILTKQDKALLSTQGLKTDKAETLKPLWAKGFTAKAASKNFKERGYSYETVRRYWTVFNTPLSDESGEGL